MKFSFILSAATLYSLASAVTHYHTQIHYVTVDANGNYVGGARPPASTPVADSGSNEVYGDSGSNEVNEDSDSGAGVQQLVTVSAQAANTPVQKAVTSKAATTPAKKAAATPAQKAAAASSKAAFSGLSDGIYAEIESSGADADFAKQMLDAHNEKRALHSAGDLSWDTEVYKYAQAFADQYSCGSGLQHSGGKYGENLALGYNSATAALNGWYDEVNGYDYSSYGYNHFTQVVWKSTTKLGCAYKDCSGSWYVICSYDPAGNIIGQFPENVFAS